LSRNVGNAFGHTGARARSGVGLIASTDAGKGGSNRQRGRDDICVGDCLVLLPVLFGLSSRQVESELGMAGTMCVSGQASHFLPRIERKQIEEVVAQAQRQGSLCRRQFYSLLVKDVSANYTMGMADDGDMGRPNSPRFTHLSTWRTDKMGECPVEMHNRFGSNYDGRVVIVSEIDGWRCEKCSVCGQVFYQRVFRPHLKSGDALLLSEEQSWWCRSRRVRLT